MGASPRFGRCAFCQRQFRHRSGPGRRRAYCDTKCRRRAQRRRDEERAPAPVASQPWARSLAEQLHALSAQLVEAELQSAPLGVLMEFAERLKGELACFTAAAVHDARMDGASWTDVAKATGTGAESARARWSTDRVKRLLERRARQQPVQLPRTFRPSLPGQVGETGALPSGRLAAALSYLQRTSQISVAEAARQADLSSSYVSRILAGDRLPAWPVVHMLATIFGGDAGDLRALWERAQGPAGGARQSVDSAAEKLHGALRGLYLAAACPDPAVLCAGTGMDPETASAVLGGEQVPDWPTTARLVAQLQAAPGDIRPLWEDVHYAFLASQDVFPAGGLVRPVDG
ncbi:helix-turn-helix domain-containing protein [Streptomyces sp. NPDC052236]|uniref:helix-turn-helix domain-containing protein n=1 Tax=Streptomyces sp. NPDC052236 TaxID=3365686 RepID=UPI0037D65533